MLLKGCTPITAREARDDSIWAFMVIGRSFRYSQLHSSGSALLTGQIQVK